MRNCDSAWASLLSTPRGLMCLLFCRETVPKAGEANVRSSEVKAVAQTTVSQHGSIAEMGKDTGVEMVAVGLVQEKPKISCVPTLLTSDSPCAV